MIYKFNEVLNDLVDYFILGDILLLKRWQKQNNLPDDLATAFITSAAGDDIVSDGILLPLKGIENYPYTIIFNFSDDMPKLLEETSDLQLRRGGYTLKVENNILVLFTWPVLSQFSDGTIYDLMNRRYNKPLIQIENGWYSIEILGGESLQENDTKNINTGEIVRYTDLEPTFEFVFKKTENQQQGAIDPDFVFSIISSNY